MTHSLSPNLLTLAHWMAGEFSNHQQAAARPSLFAHIHVYFRPLPFDFFSAIGFYSEQVYDYDLWSPYRQGVHRLVDRGGSVYIENYSLEDSIRFAGASRYAEILQTISHDVIKRRDHCSMVFQRDGEQYLGGVEPGNNCLIPRDGKLTYLVSEVVLTSTTWDSRDRGFDPDTHEYVWGSEHGHLCFVKLKSFANELPPLP
ncbi:MAG: chorismate-binding protein [Cyanothece sp. SIO2G6]|nr:chorismate-binding protein [Cyanothece sp. SIO2G6]